MYFNWNFNDLDEMVETVIGWDLNFLPLEKGIFPSTITQIMFPNTLIAEANFSKRVEQRGTTPQAYRTFVVPKYEEVYYDWRGKKIKGNMLSLFPPSGELYSVSNKSFHVYTLSFTQNIITSAIECIKDSSLENIIKNEYVWQVDARQLQSIHFLLNQVIEISKNNLLRNTYETELKLLMAIVQSIKRSSPILISQSRNRDLALKKSIELIHSLPHDSDFKLSKLYQASRVSERTLQYAFLEKFGVTPIEYIKNYKLRLVNKALKKQKNEKIHRIAADYGFWHMGQFAADYMKYIGELPSQTQGGF